MDLIPLLKYRVSIQLRYKEDGGLTVMRGGRFTMARARPSD
ncbi:hypothetical protein [Bifidobacterium sp.]|jgi:hypothetical protein|nr:hypothetical protein [Bifidobacterium sp.]